MAKHDTDPVLAQLVHSVDESVQAAVPVTVTAHGTVLTGHLVAQERYFADLVQANPMLAALQPAQACSARSTPRRWTTSRPPPAPADDGHSR